MVQEQQHPQRPGTDPETRELEPMQRPDDMPQLDEERQIEHEEGASAPQEWSEPTGNVEGAGIEGDAAPPIGSELESTTDRPGIGAGQQGAGAAETQGGAEQVLGTHDPEGGSDGPNLTDHEIAQAP